MKKTIILLCLVTSLFATDNNNTQSTGVDSLSGGLRVLLSQEMLSIEKGMKSIFSNIISVNY